MKKIAHSCAEVFRKHPRPTYNAMFFLLFFIIGLFIFIKDHNRDYGKTEFIKAEIEGYDDGKKLDVLNTLFSGGKYEFSTYLGFVKYRVAAKYNYIELPASDRVAFAMAKNYKIAYVGDSFYISSNATKGWEKIYIDEKARSYQWQQVNGYNNQYVFFKATVNDTCNVLVFTGKGTYAIAQTGKINVEVKEGFNDVMVGYDNDNARFVRYVYNERANSFRTFLSQSLQGNMAKWAYSSKYICNDYNNYILTFSSTIRSYEGTYFADSLLVNNSRESVVVPMPIDSLSGPQNSNEFTTLNNKIYLLSTGKNIAMYSVGSYNRLQGKYVNRRIADSLPLKAKPIMSTSGAYFHTNKNWLFGEGEALYINADEKDSVRFTPFKLSSRFAGFTWQGLTYTCKDDGIFLLVFDQKKNRHILTLTDTVFTEDADSATMQKISAGSMFFPQYSNSTQFMMYYGNFAWFDVTKTSDNSGYQYEMVNNHIQWPAEPFTVTTDTDYFLPLFIIMLICAVYFIGFFLLRSWTDKDEVISDLDRPDSLFAVMPTFKSKVKEVKEMANSLKSRSNNMLALGIILGLVGVIASIIVFNSVDNGIKGQFDTHMIIKLLRATILLVFIETFTFFFLKQYRVIFNEYKLYYSVYLKLMNYAHLYEMKEGQLTTADVFNRKTIEQVLTEKFDLYESNAKSQINEFDNASILKLIEILGNTSKKTTGTG